MLSLNWAELLPALFSIIVIDLLLAGDNAVVIGMAARNLPKEHQKKAIVWGTVGAIVTRIIATVVVVYLLTIPGLMLAGGLLLTVIAYKLLMDKQEEHKAVKADTRIWKAIGTIVLADSVMGLDNVLAVAGAAKGHTGLVIIGLLISVPIMVYGSTLIIKLLERFPWVIYLGSGILAWTAGHMITGEKLLGGIMEQAPALKWLVGILMVVAVLGLGKIMKDREARGQIRNMEA